MILIFLLLCQTLLAQSFLMGLRTERPSESSFCFHQHLTVLSLQDKQSLGEGTLCSAFLGFSKRECWMLSTGSTRDGKGMDLQVSQDASRQQQYSDTIFRKAFLRKKIYLWKLLAKYCLLLPIVATGISRAILVFPSP